MHSAARVAFITQALAVGALCALPLRISSAQNVWEPPGDLFERFERATVRRILLSRFRLGPVTVTLEHTPLAELQRAFPRGAIGEAGDAAGYVAWLCYIVGSEPNRSTLWVQSGEMGGDEHAVTGFTLLLLAPGAQVDHRCVSLPDSAVALGLPHQVRLGATRRQLIAALGRPSEEHGDTLGYFHMADVPPEGREPAGTVISSLCILLRAGRVVRIDVWKVSTT